MADPLELKDMIELDKDDPRNGCDLCRFGVVDMPDLWHLKPGKPVPYYVARAMALNIDGLCYIMYCDCPAGKNALKYDQKNRDAIDKIETTGISGKDGWRTWTDLVPSDHIPGSWWYEIRRVCHEHYEQRDGGDNG